MKKKYTCRGNKNPKIRCISSYYETQRKVLLKGDLKSLHAEWESTQSWGSDCVTSQSSCMLMNATAEVLRICLSIGWKKKWWCRGSSLLTTQWKQHLSQNWNTHYLHKLRVRVSGCSAVPQDGVPQLAHEWPPHGNILLSPKAGVLLELVPFAWVHVTVQSLEKFAPCFSWNCKFQDPSFHSSQWL